MISIRPRLLELGRSNGLCHFTSTSLPICKTTPVLIPGLPCQHQPRNNTLPNIFPWDGEGDRLHSNIVQAPDIFYHAMPNYGQLVVQVAEVDVSSCIQLMLWAKRKNMVRWNLYNNVPSLEARQLSSKRVRKNRFGRSRP